MDMDCWLCGKSVAVVVLETRAELMVKKEAE